jgi:hypothetical protein
VPRKKKKDEEPPDAPVPPEEEVADEEEVTEEEEEEQKPEKGFSLTPDQAKKILQKDISNLVRKVASGGSLNAAQRQLIQSSIEDPSDAIQITWAKNQVELGDALGVDRKTIQRWIKETDAPSARSDGRYSVAEWSAWTEKTGRKTVDVTKPDEYRQLEIRRLKTICERLDLELSETKGNYTLNSEVEAMVRRMVGQARKVLSRIPSTLAPQLSGLSIADIEMSLKEAVHGAMEQLHNGNWDE